MMAHSITTAATDHAEPRFSWRWFLGWTLFSSAVIFAALKILTGMNPPQPFTIAPFNNPDLGRLVLLAMVVVTLVFSVYFLTFATLPGIGPHTSPAGRWLIVALVLVIVMTATFVAGSISYSPDPSALTRERVLALIGQAGETYLKQETLATALLLSLTLALSTAAVVSNLTTAIRNCTEEQEENIRWFLLWMHGALTAIVLVYSVLLFKTNIRLPQFSNGLFIGYFVLLYMMISFLIFLIPALKYKLLSTKTALWSFAGINLPPWTSSLLSKFGIESSLPPYLAKMWNLI